MSEQTGNRVGSRQLLPKNAHRVCASCEADLPRRGAPRKEWERIFQDKEPVGWICGECPHHWEPIRREKRGDRVRFVAVLRGVPGVDGKRPQHKRRFDSLTDAREWVTEVREGVKAATRKNAAYSDPKLLTVRMLCEQWINKRREEVGVPGGIREVTVNGSASSLHAVLIHMGDEIARDVTPGEVETMLRKLATVGGKWGRPLAHRSIVYALSSLRQAYKYGVREKWVTTNPAAEVTPPIQSHRTARKASARLRWTPAEVVLLRSHADTYGDGELFAAEPWLRVGMRLTLTGMRRSEVLGLDWQRVNIDAGTVRIEASRVKTGRGTATALGDVKAENSLRTVEVERFHPGTSAALRALWLAQGRPEAGLVILDALGEPVHPNAYSRRFRSLCEEAGLPALTSIHNLRHSIATALEAADLPASKAAALLGHDVETYRRFYLVTDDEGAADAAEVGGRVFAV